MLEFYFCFGLFKFYKNINYVVMKKKFLRDIGCSNVKKFHRMKNL